MSTCEFPLHGCQSGCHPKAGTQYAPGTQGFPVVSRPARAREAVPANLTKVTPEKAAPFLEALAITAHSDAFSILA